MRQEDSCLPRNTVTWPVVFPAIGIKVSIISPKIPEWALDIMKYLDNNKLPSDKREAQKVRNREAHFTVIDKVLYKRGFFKPLLRCVS